MRRYISIPLILFLAAFGWKINAQSGFHDLIKSAQLLTEGGEFDSAFQMLISWKDTLSLNPENQYLLALTISISAIEARKGKEARKAFAKAEKLNLHIPSSFLLVPENQFTLAEIYFKLGRNPDGCAVVNSMPVYSENTVENVRYLFLKALCYAGSEPDSVITYDQAALDQLKNTRAAGSWLDAKIRGSLGNTLRDRDPEAALHYYLREAEILHKIFPTDHLETAGAHYNAANVYYALLDYTRAINEYKKAYPGFAKNYKPGDRYMRFLNEAVGDMFWETGLKDSAIIYYDRSVIGADQVSLDKGEKLNASGDSTLTAGAADKALIYYRSALAFRQEQFGARHPLTAACNNFIARVYNRNGQTEEAMRIYQQSLLGFTKDFSDTSVYTNPSVDQIHIGNEQYAIEALSAKANGFVKRFSVTKKPKDILAAQECIDRCMMLIERSRSLPITEESRMFWSRIAHPVYELAIDIALQRYQLTNDKSFVDMAFIAMEKSRAYTLLLAMQFEAAGYRNLPSNLLAKEKYLKQAIGEYGGKILREEKRCGEASDKKLESWKNQLEKIYNAYSAYLNDIKNKYPEYYTMRYSMEVISLPELQMKMDEETVVISVFQGESKLTVFAVGHDGDNIRQYPIDNTFPGTVENLLYLLKTPSADVPKNSETWQSLCNGLYSSYFAETLHAFPKWNKLIIVSDGVLSYIPFEILLSPATDADHASSTFNILENYSISYSPSATILAHTSGIPRLPVSSFTGIAPDYSGQSANHTRDTRWLKYNIAEVVNLGTLFSRAKLYTGSISHDQFLVRSASAGILHLAMHAEIDAEEPMLSSFLLSGKEGDDQKVYAYEIQSQTLHAQHAVLSACNTGIGLLRRGEGMMSLARCFQYAGCQSMVVSLWPVDDLATSELMQYYYTHLLEGQRKDIALQRAKLDYLQHADPATRHPFYWAGFILIGNTDPLEISENRFWWVWVVAGGLLVFCLFLLWPRSLLITHH